MNQLTDSLVTSLLLVPAIVSLATTPAPPQCRVSEFPCSDSRCIPLTSYCNSVNDCGDSSDEPRFCTPCNRTYYGDVGKTYEIELHRPKEDRMPFVCHLTLAAGSGDLGDLVQVTFERFTLGRFDSFIRDGCPDGEMQIWEWDRPRIGGSWCGTSWGPSVYFSETRSVTVSLRLLRIARDQSGYNFDFKMSFKMLPKKEAIVRYGGFKFPGGILESNTSSLPVPTPRHYLGELIDGTFCSRVFTDCNRKDCRLQSPNFPGIYPRNLTCYYAVRQQEIPAGKHALISVRQGKGQLINIRSQATLYTRAQQQPAQVKQLKVWEECDQVQDYVTIYDGYTTRDPVLLKFCGGGSSVPETISSGHELLVEFSTSPYGTFLYPAPPLPLNGFQLQVQVKFVDKDAPKYARNKRCEFWLRGTGKGILESPRHSLAGNTTCLYHLQGADPNITPPPRHLEMLARRRTHGTLYPTRYKVWLAVLKYHVSALSEEEACAARLQIWDGNVRAAPSCNDIFCDKDTSHGSLIYTQTKSNLTLLARYCKDHVPRSCDHSLLTNSSRSPRPCSLAESFLSTGDSLTLELKIRESTALRPVSFRALYEFVDLQQDGEPYGTAPCSRRFVSRSQDQTTDTQTFSSPKDVFLYGRGGATNLSCVYRFEAQKGENIRIILTGLQTGIRKDCTTHLNPDSNRLQCVGNATAFLHFWDSTLSVSNVLPRDCLCSSSETFLPFTFTSAAHIVEVKFNVIHMSSSEDFRALNFEARYEFVRSSVCTRRQKVSGPSGEIFFRSPSRTPEEVNCEGQPWLIIPRESRYLYVQIRGVLIKGAKSVEQNNITSVGVKCTTKNRVLIHSGSDVHVLVCPLAAEPQRHHLVEVFSEGWVISSSNERLPPVWSSNGGSQARSIMVEFISKEPGMYSVTWLELSRRASVPAAGLSDCPHRCPELDACINSSLWCDGTSHCPSGYDEAAKHCFYLLQLPLLYLAMWTLGLFSLIFVTVYIICRICKRNPRSSRLKSLPSDTEAIVGTPKEVIC